MRFRTHLMTHACYAPDDGTGAPDAPVLDTSPDTPPPADDPAPDGPPAEPPAAPQGPVWYQQRIGEVTRARGEAERRAAAAERERDELRAKVQPDPNAAPDPNAERLYTKADLDREARSQAAQMAAEEARQQAYVRTMQAGFAEYTPAAFNAACDALVDAGANDSQAFRALVYDLPNAHEVLHRLGTDPAEAVRILAMPPLRMAAEIGRVSAAAKAPPAPPAAPPPRPASKAPPPVDPIGGGAAPTPETDLNKMTTAQYMKARGYTK